MWVEVQQQNPLFALLTAITQTTTLPPMAWKCQPQNFFGTSARSNRYLRDNGKNKGKIEGEHLQGIFELVKYINSSKFWQALIEQIYVAQNGDLYLQPKLGNFEILLGTTNNMETKLANFEAFYYKSLIKLI